MQPCTVFCNGFSSAFRPVISTDPRPLEKRPFSGLFGSAFRSPRGCATSAGAPRKLPVKALDIFEATIEFRKASSFQPNRFPLVARHFPDPGVIKEVDVGINIAGAAFSNERLKDIRFIVHIELECLLKEIQIVNILPPISHVLAPNLLNKGPVFLSDYLGQAVGMKLATATDVEDVNMSKVRLVEGNVYSDGPRSLPTLGTGSIANSDTQSGKSGLGDVVGEFSRLYFHLAHERLRANVAKPCNRFRQDLIQDLSDLLINALLRSKSGS